tara:strand:- start:711 stop:1043 length:333 start_codon:yes stop_codon:yes gene_type:complete
MKIYKFDEMVGGWFIGDFSPSSFKTKDFEVCYKKHSKGEKWDTHYHKLGTEINYLIKGKIKIQNRLVIAGEIFILSPYEIADPKFLEDCELVIVKTPSNIKDKYVVDIKK